VYLPVYIAPFINVAWISGLFSNSVISHTLKGRGELEWIQSYLFCLFVCFFCQQGYALFQCIFGRLSAILQVAGDKIWPINYITQTFLKFISLHFVFSCLEWLEHASWCAVAMSLVTWDSREGYESDQCNQTRVDWIKLAAQVNW